MIKVTVTKNLIGLEDLLVGMSTEEQVRGATGSDPVTITEINGSNFPYDATYTMSEKIDNLQAQMDTLPEVVDENGILLTGLINTSTVDLDLENRLWRKTIDVDTAELYYHDELLFQYNPTAGNLIVPDDYIAADAIIQGNLDVVDLATANVQDLEVGTTANCLVQLDGAAKLPAIDGSQLTNIATCDSNPVGAILTVAYSTPDTGYLECDGSAIDRTTYASLFTKIGVTYGSGDGSTTFNIPDLRGEFIRGWDNGRAIDSSRAIGTFQEDAFKAHSHLIQLDDTTGGGTGVLSTGGSWTGGSQVLSTGGSETRPRNISMMYQIKVL